MAQFTYTDIKQGKIVKLEDTLMLYHAEHVVKEEEGVGYYLRCGGGGGHNDWIFRHLGIENKYKFCESSSGRGIFPYVKTLEDLTRIIKKLWEYNPIREGDKVKVRSIHQSPSDYGVYVANDMASSSGKYIQCEHQYFEDHDRNIKYGVYVGIFASGFFWSGDILDFTEIEKTVADKADTSQQANERLEFEPAPMSEHHSLHPLTQERCSAAGLILPKKNKNLEITL